MPYTVNPAPGILITGEFERANPKLREELQQFIARLTALQKQQGIEAIVPLIKEQGGTISVTVLPAALGAPGSQDARDAAGLSASLGSLLVDRFVGSGRLKLPAPALPEDYPSECTTDAGDMLAGWFPEEQA